MAENVTFKGVSKILETPVHGESPEMPKEGTPEWEVFQRTVANITSPLGLMTTRDIPEADVPVIINYALKAAKLALKEFQRVQRESLAQQLIGALKAELEKVGGNEDAAKLVSSSIATIEKQVSRWQKAVSEAQGVAAINGEKKTVNELVAEQITLRQKQIAGRVPGDKIRGIEPTLGILITDRLTWSPEVSDRMATAHVAEGVLKKLGFLPEEASLGSLFTLPEVDAPQTKALRWQGKPTRVSWEKVWGLSSQKLPGVAAQIEELGGDRALVWFDLKPEAVARTLTGIQGAAVPAR